MKDQDPDGGLTQCSMKTAHIIRRTYSLALPPLATPTSQFSKPGHSFFPLRERCMYRLGSPRILPLSLLQPSCCNSLLRQHKVHHLRVSFHTSDTSCYPVINLDYHLFPAKGDASNISQQRSFRHWKNLIVLGVMSVIRINPDVKL